MRRRRAVLAASAALLSGVGLLAVPSASAGRSGSAALSGAAGAAAGWRNVGSRALAYQGSLDRVDVVGKKVAWAVGARGGLLNRTAVVLRWNGTRWARQTGPFGFTPTDVAGATPRKAWVVGFGTSGVVAAHWNGAKWKRVGYPAVGIPSQVSAAPDGTAYSVAGVDNGSGGLSAVLRWNGKKFVRVNVPLPPSTSITAVDVRARNNVWLAGTTTANGTQVTGLVLHFNGSKWRRIPVPGTMGMPALQGALYKIAAISPKNVYVSRVAQQAQIPNALLHWNGAGWRVLPTPLAAAGIGLSPDGSGGVWVTTAATANRTLYLRWTGKSWATLRGPARNGKATLGDVDRIPGTRGAFAVGTVSRQGKSYPFIERY